MSEENKQVTKTFLSSWGASIPADIAGAYVGSRLGRKFLPNKIKVPFSSSHISGGEMGGTLGAIGASGVTELAAIKHSLHGKIKNEQRN